MFSKIYNYLKSCPLEHNRKLLVLSLLILILLALIPRIAGVILNSGNFLYNDGVEYRTIAEQISKGNGFSIDFYRWYEAVPEKPERICPDFSRPPVFPLLGAILFFLPFDWECSALFTVLLLSIFCILIVFQLGREIFRSNTVGFLSAVIYAFYPYSIYHSLFWSSENLFLILFCAAWIFLIRSVRNGFCWKSAALCGVFMALSVMTRPQGMIVPLLLGITAIFFLVKNLRTDRVFCGNLFRGGLVFVGALLLVFSPWMIRNWYHCGIPSPFSFYGDYSFSQASSDVSYVTYRYVDTPQYAEKAEEIWESFHKEKRDLLKSKNAFQVLDANRYWRQWAWEYIRENPDKMAFIVKNRVLHCFRAAPNSAAIPYQVVVIMRIYFVFFLALALFGLCRAGKDFATLSLLIPSVGVLILSVPFLMTLRYRYPFFAPFAAVLAAYGLFELCRFYSERNRKNENLCR